MVQTPHLVAPRTCCSRGGAESAAPLRATYPTHQSALQRAEKQRAGTAPVAEGLWLPLKTQSIQGSGWRSSGGRLVLQGPPPKCELQSVQAQPTQLIPSRLGMLRCSDSRHQHLPLSPKYGHIFRRGHANHLKSCSYVLIHPFSTLIENSCLATAPHIRVSDKMDSGLIFVCPPEHASGTQWPTHCFIPFHRPAGSLVESASLTGSSLEAQTVNPQVPLRNIDCAPGAVSHCPSISIEKLNRVGNNCLIVYHGEIDPD